MVALLTEFRTAKGILEEEKVKLVAEGVAVADDIEVGIMIESLLQLCLLTNLLKKLISSQLVQTILSNTLWLLTV